MYSYRIWKKGRSYYSVMVMYCMATDLARFIDAHYHTTIYLPNDLLFSAYIILHVYDHVRSVIEKPWLSLHSCASILLTSANNFMAYIPNHALAGLRNYKYKGVDKCVFHINHMVNR